MKVLILGVAPVQMDALICLNEIGIDTYSVAMANDGPGSLVSHQFEIIDILNEQWLEQYILDNQIDAIYSAGSDLAMPIACRLSEKLGLPHFVPSTVAVICNNKNLMRQTLGPDFAGNIHFQILSTGNEAIQVPFPSIIKPADSQGQRGVSLVNNLQELSLAFPTAQKYSRTGLVILEKYIDGPEFSVNGYLVDGELVFYLVSDRHTWPGYTGLVHRHLVPSRILSVRNESNIRSMLKEASEKIGITDGPFYAQIKIIGDHPYIIEITPRLDGCHLWRPIKYYTGMNLLKLTFEHLLANNLSELQQLKSFRSDNYTLEFICQEPMTPASYTNVQDQLDRAVDHFFYYQEGDMIRPVNNQYEKIGYMIYKD
jgi:biotin carboxylase